MTRRIDAQGATSFEHNWYYASGHRIGEAGNDPGGNSRNTYAEQLALLERQGKSDPKRSKT